MGIPRSYLNCYVFFKTIKFPGSDLWRLRQVCVGATVTGDQRQAIIASEEKIFQFQLPEARFGDGSIPINTIFSGMNIHLPAILMWTTGVQGFDTLPFPEKSRLFLVVSSLWIYHDLPNQPGMISIPTYTRWYWDILSIGDGQVGLKPSHDLKCGSGW